MNKYHPYPKTMLPLGEHFNYGSITNVAAASITKIDVVTIGSAESNKREGKPEGYYPYSLIDICANDQGGKEMILIRSDKLRKNKKQLRSIMRETTRKVAVFMLETKLDNGKKNW